MYEVGVAADPEALVARIRQAIVASGMSQQALADRIGMDPTALSKVLTGKRRLSSLELALIADATSVSVDELLAPDRRPGSHVAARTQPDKSPAVEQAVRRVKDFLEIDGLLSDLGLSASASPLPLEVAEGAYREQAIELAKRVRDVAGIGDIYIDELASFCENRLGVDVAVECLPPGLDGLSVSCGNYRLALVSSAIPATRQRYTLAHEIGHLAAGDTQKIMIDEDLFGRPGEQEKRANIFASAFLMPESSLRRAMGTAGLVEASIGDMLANYKVSLDALAWQLYSFRLVDIAGRERVRQLSTRKLSLLAGHAAEYQRQLQDQGQRRLPSGLLRRAIEAYNKGDIGVRVLARLAEVRPEILQEQLSPLPPAPESEDDPDHVLVV
jgi:Zn-dependent peptidase ImmA (M78 family)/transcriptional regulator with XRE-family HTH domain